MRAENLQKITCSWPPLKRWLPATSSDQFRCFTPRFYASGYPESSPDYGQATGLRGEDVDLIGALAHEDLLTLVGIGRLNVPVHALGKRMKVQSMLYVLSQAAYRFPDSTCYIWRVLASN